LDDLLGQLVSTLPMDKGSLTLQQGCEGKKFIVTADPLYPACFFLTSCQLGGLAHRGCCSEGSSFILPSAGSPLGSCALTYGLVLLNHLANAFSWREITLFFAFIVPELSCLYFVNFPSSSLLFHRALKEDCSLDVRMIPFHSGIASKGLIPRDISSNSSLELPKP
jgi:hypothetical protein